MRPPAPVPLTRLRSILFSRAILRTSGESGPDGSAAGSAAGSSAGVVSGSTGGGAGAAAGAAGAGGRGSGGFSGGGLLNGSYGLGRGRSAFFRDARHYRVDAYRRTFFHQHLGQRAGGGRRDFRIHFIG